jgi:hypothetical protein
MVGLLPFDAGEGEELLAWAGIVVNGPADG